MSTTSVEFTKEDYSRLKEQYNKAVEDNREQFVFDGHVLLVTYAKYLIEYLGSKFD